MVKTAADDLPITFRKGGTGFTLTIGFDTAKA